MPFILMAVSLFLFATPVEAKTPDNLFQRLLSAFKNGVNAPWGNTVYKNLLNINYPLAEQKIFFRN